MGADVTGAKNEPNIAFVRTEDAPLLPPPGNETGFSGWLWRNVLSSMTNFGTPAAALQSVAMIVLTVGVAYFGLSILWGILRFSVIDAVWFAQEGERRLACATTTQGGELPSDWYGACYPYVSAKWQQFVYGRFPEPEIWRVNLVFLIGSLGIAWLLANSIPRRRFTGICLVLTGVALGFLVASPSVFNETFGERVGVQILIGVGVMYALLPSNPPKRIVAILMLTLFPLLALILLTGADLEISAGFWATLIVLIAIFAGLAFITRAGFLGEGGAAFGGLLTSAVIGLSAVLVVTFITSSRFVDIVEAVGGATKTERELQAIDWWKENNVVDTPILASELTRAGVERWGDAEVEALARSIQADLSGPWDVEAAIETLDRFDDALSPSDRASVVEAIENAATRLPTAARIAELGADTGLNLSEEEISRLNVVAWDHGFLNVASAPDSRLIWPLPTVITELWGGLLVTLVVAIVGIVFSLPLGVLLALGRRSSLPAVRILSILFIEFWRGVPLITILFMSSVMLPLFLPEGADLNKLVRALIGVMLFAAAYQAEVVRGGFQAIPKGQFEAAEAIGLSYWPSMRLIVLPQALTLVIPGIVNTFIGLFKDTTLVGIIGVFDLLLAVRTSFADAAWAVPVQRPTGFLVACVIYFIFCWGMSQYSLYMERQLRKGHAR